MNKLLLTAAATALLSAPAIAGTVNLNTWTENGNPNNNAGTWTVQAGDDAVVQSINGNPTVFFDGTSNAQGTALRGNITVANDGDDDFIGFVLGYQDGEITSTNADFWLIDWKQGQQDGQTPGLALSHVVGDLSNSTTPGITDSAWWQHTDPVFEKIRASTLGLTGYNDTQEYTFDLIFSEDLIQVKVDGDVELNYTSADNGGNKFTDGSFGFYNFSQSAVTYGSIVEDETPPELNAVPLPAGLPLILAGLGAFAMVRRRKD